MAVATKRAYEASAEGDGYRVLVDRLWPRGVSKERLRVDEWRRDLAPSTELRKWFGHDPLRWDEFRRRYLDELRSGPAAAALAELAERAGSGPLTLVYAARDTQHNEAQVLAELLDQQRRDRTERR